MFKLPCPIHGQDAFQICAIQHVRTYSNGDEVHRCRNRTKQGDGSRCRLNKGVTLHKNGNSNEVRKAGKSEPIRETGLSVPADSFTS